MSEKGEVILRGVGTLRYVFTPDASVQRQPGGLTIHTKRWFLGAGFIGAPPISLTMRTVHMPAEPTSMVIATTISRPSSWFSARPACVLDRCAVNNPTMHCSREGPFLRCAVHKFLMISLSTLMIILSDTVDVESHRPGWVRLVHDAVGIASTSKLFLEQHHGMRLPLTVLVRHGCGTVTSAAGVYC